MDLGKTKRALRAAVASATRTRDQLRQVKFTSPTDEEKLRAIEALLEESLLEVKSWILPKRPAHRPRDRRKELEDSLQRKGVFRFWAKRAKTLHDLGERAAKLERRSCRRGGEDEGQTVGQVAKAREEAIRSELRRIGITKPDDVKYWLEASKCESEMQFLRRFQVTSRQLRRRPENRFSPPWHRAERKPSRV